MVKKTQKSRPLMQRWFGPITNGSLRGSILTLVSSMIGVGFMTLPVIGKNNGVYSILFFVLYSGTVSWFANIQIGRGFKHSFGKTYPEIIERINGSNLSLVALIFLFLYVFASSGSYYIFGKIHLLLINEVFIV
jgi:amino acid permease